MITVDVVGAEELSRKLMQLGASVGDIQAGLQKAGLAVAARAKANAPVDSGRLRDSITAKTSGDYCDVGTNVEYGIYQEFGTYKMAAHPFLLPALEESRAEIEEIIAAEVRSRL